MSFIPKPHEIYKHFKGNLYQIVAIAEHSETGEQLVVYQALYGDFKTYARELSMFTGRVDKDKYPEATQEFRFELQGADGERQNEEREQQGAGGEHQNEEREQQGAGGEHQSTEREQQGADGECRGADREQRTESVAEVEIPDIDPLVLEFLDADSYEQRLNILAALHHRITDEMITTMAIVCDIEVEDGDTEQKYESLKSCLLTKEKYECNRMR